MSKTNLWYAMWVGDFAVETGHLSAEAVGALVRLNNAIWSAGGAIKNDPRELANRAGIPLKRWKSIFAELADAFDVVDGKLTSKRLGAEFARVEKIRVRNRENADKRWAAERDAAAYGSHATRMRLEYQDHANNNSNNNSNFSACKDGGRRGVVPTQNAAEVQP